MDFLKIVWGMHFIGAHSVRSSDFNSAHFRPEPILVSQNQLSFFAIQQQNDIVASFQWMYTGYVTGRLGGYLNQ